MLRSIVIELLAKQISIDSVFPDEEDLLLHGLSSIKFIHFIVDLEMKFEMEVPQQDLSFENFSTIQKINSYVSQHSSVAKKSTA